MAVTPAIMILILSQSLAKMVIGAVVSFSRGRFVESSAVVHRDLRAKLRDMERMLSTSPTYNLIQSYPSNYTSSTVNQSTEVHQSINMYHQGHILSILYRLQTFLLVNSIHFERYQLKQIQVSCTVY
jgi:hypothetical protein